MVPSNGSINHWNCDFLAFSPDSSARMAKSGKNFCKYSIIAISADLSTSVTKSKADLLKISSDFKLPTPFPRISYSDAIEQYGVDRPDIRFDLKIQTVTEMLHGTEFQVFNSTIENQGVIAGIVVKNTNFSRKQLDGFNELAQTFGAKGLLFLKVTETGLQGSITKFLSPEQQQNLLEKFKTKEGDLVVLVADTANIAFKTLGALRTHFAGMLNLIDKNKIGLLWVTEFPLLEYNDEEQRFFAMHHPFTSPKVEDIPLMDSDPGAVRARAYDLVLNGVEIAGGSIRIHQRELQQKMFKLLGIEKDEAEEKFGFLLEAFEYGAPPHGGIAFGLDRLMMILAGRKSIRDVIAFPKTTSALSLMDGSPSVVDKKQLEELGLQLIKSESKQNSKPQSLEGSKEKT